MLERLRQELGWYLSVSHRQDTYIHTDMLVSKRRKYPLRLVAFIDKEDRLIYRSVDSLHRQREDGTIVLAL